MMSALHMYEAWSIWSAKRKGFSCVELCIYISHKWRIFWFWTFLNASKHALVGIAIEYEKKNRAILVKIFTKWHFGQCVDLRRVPSTVHSLKLNILCGKRAQAWDILMGSNLRNLSYARNISLLDKYVSCEYSFSSSREKALSPWPIMMMMMMCTPQISLFINRLLMKY